MTSSGYEERRSPRVRLAVHADVACQGNVLEAMTENLGPSGCLVRMPSLDLPGDPVKLLLRSSRVRESLLTEGVVAWHRGHHSGIAFSEKDQEAVAAWFRRIVDPVPMLRRELASGPGRLDSDRRLFLGEVPWTGAAPLDGDQMLVLRAFEDRCTIRSLAFRVPLDSVRLSRAVIALLRRRLLVSEPALLPVRRRRSAGRAAMTFAIRPHCSWSLVPSG